MVTMNGNGHIIAVENLSLWYGETIALRNVTMNIADRKVTALIGPSGCGKSTLLRCFNRMNDLVESCRIDGAVNFHGKNIYAPGIDPVAVRKEIGMVFQRPNPFPKSIWENIAYGPKVHGMKDKKQLDAIVEKSKTTKQPGLSLP